MGQLEVAAWGERARLDETRGLLWAAAKRCIDLLLAVIALIMLIPALCLIAVLIKLESRGPVLFRQERIGRHGRSFTMLKLRTMRHGASAEPHRRYVAAGARPTSGDSLRKLTSDDRVTRIGRLLRRTSLDEVPQLFHVLTGKMSIVGPRPAIDYELALYDPRHFDRFDVRPGLTGLWQVSGRNELGFAEMLDIDADYARNAGPLLDAVILVRTPVAIVKARTA